MPKQKKIKKRASLRLGAVVAAAAVSSILLHYAQRSPAHVHMTSALRGRKGVSLILT